MKSLLGLVQSAPVRIDLEFKELDGKPYKNTTTIKTKKEEVTEVPVYSNHDSVMGEIRLTPLTTKKLEHQGIKIQLVGQIELAGERGTAHEFVSLVRELAAPGELNSSKQYPLEYRNVELQYDSYKGQQVRCRYLLRVTVSGKGMTPDSKRDFHIWVTNYEEPSDASTPIKMEVGIEDCLHIEFEYDKGRYHLADVVVGRIYFLLVRIKLKHMEIEIRRKETTGAGSHAHSESETLAKYEIMDGAPVRGESVPIRLYLSPYDLAPTYRDVHNKYSVRYFLNLVLVDEEDRRYFKQQEITLFRQAPGTPAPTGGPPKLSSPTRNLLSRNGSVNGAGPASPPPEAAPAAPTPALPPVYAAPQQVPVVVTAPAPAQPAVSAAPPAAVPAAAPTPVPPLPTSQPPLVASPVPGPPPAAPALAANEPPLPLGGASSPTNTTPEPAGELTFGEEGGSGTGGVL